MDVLEAIAQIVDAVFPERIYLRTYECTVERQADDGTLDLLPDDEKIRGKGHQGVPIYHGLPGVTVRVARGARVLLQFVAGDPTKPFASLWRTGDIEEISFAGGQAPVARQGDSVAVYWPASVPVTGTLGGQPFTGTMTIATQGAGIIQSGAAAVKA